jgi:hypothetical protein
MNLVAQTASLLCRGLPARHPFEAFSGSSFMDGILVPAFLYSSELFFSIRGNRHYIPVPIL